MGFPFMNRNDQHENVTEPHKKESTKINVSVLFASFLLLRLL
jgi:hypothetical protein